jgi:hypothetical protein
MFGITTFMFALGIISLVLETTLVFQLAQNFAPILSTSYVIRYNVWGTITCLIVRFGDAFVPSDHSINGCAVYSMRYNLCLARGSSLEKRQTHHRRTCVLHPWDHRYVKGISQYRHFVLIWNHRLQLLR